MSQKRKKLQDFTFEHKEFSIVDGELYCNRCKKFINYSDKCGLNSAVAHLTTKKHSEVSSCGSLTENFKFKTKNFNGVEEEIFEMLEAFISAGISINALNSEKLKIFLEKK